MPAPAPKYFKAWIAFFLIATVGGSLLGGVAGMIIGLVLKYAAHAEPTTIKWAVRIVGFAIMIPLSYVAFRYVVEEIIIEDLTKAPSPAPTAEPPQIAK